MRYTWTFNGTDMSALLITNEVTRDIGPNRTGTFQQVGVSNGRRFMRSAADVATIKVACTIIDDMPEKRREIARILTTPSPAVLTFGDEAGLYYLAITDGQIDMSETNNYGQFTITFKVPDGLAHSTTPTEVSGTTDTELELTTEGSAPVAPILSVTCNSDNGLVAWANDQGGVLQFGSTDEVDGNTSVNNERPIRWTFRSAPSGSQTNASAVTSYPNRLNDPKYPNKQSGSIVYGADIKGKPVKNGELAFPVFASVSDKVWHGPSLHGAIKANGAGNQTGGLLLKARLRFKSAVKSMGRMEITLESVGKVAISCVLRDSSKTSLTKTFECWQGDKMLKSVALNAKKFSGDFCEVQMSRKGDDVVFKISEVTEVDSKGKVKTGASWSLPITLPGLGATAIDGVTLWMEKYSTTAACYMCWTDLSIDWINVETWNDQPNRFGIGDVIMADIATKTVYVNGVPDPTLQRVGNMWDSFKLQPGANVLQPVISDWATAADASVQWREAYY
ncbi:distal tail protein Dit [Lacticaseibacillus parakribbianus]|uniref:distal tail protein Dit n=1 Tax=Lacticaseibacillus parakribbianus TaxID=2970927 RepID=UPI0021CAE843|nr:distal tail protein Dit [Lacticaseibacillus parakribbianus]